MFLAEPAMGWAFWVVRVVRIAAIGCWRRVSSSLRERENWSMGLRCFSFLVTGRLAWRLPMLEVRADIPLLWRTLEGPISSWVPAWGGSRSDRLGSDIFPWGGGYQGTFTVRPLLFSGLAFPDSGGASPSFR